MGLYAEIFLELGQMFLIDTTHLPDFGHNVSEKSVLRGQSNCRLALVPGDG